MAIDEVLLATTVTPVLRLYRWDGPWVSIGCFTPRAEAEATFPGRPIVRRWTGGGIVDHASDWTYSLIIPRSASLAALGTAETYRLIHGALARTLTTCGRPAHLANSTPPGRNGLCFTAPVLADVVLGDLKIAGAAQRRTRHGLLHQGSVQGIDIPASLPAALASALSTDPVPINHDLASAALDLAHTVARNRYETPLWLDKH
jgi:lipoate-protein ligase A